MSSDTRLILEIIPFGHGLALDLGGGNGLLRQPLERLGYNYFNLDIECRGRGEPSVTGDSHVLPFKDNAFELVVSKDSLEHFLQPWMVIKEVYRVLKPGGLLIVWVPFMHGFHGNDFYRFTPLGLQHLLINFKILLFESPLWVFTVIGLIVIEVLKLLHIGFAERSIKSLCSWLDHHFTRHLRHPASFAAGYRLMAQKQSKGDYVSKHYRSKCFI